MPIKNTAVTVTIVAWDTDNNVGKTGDKDQFTLRGVGDGTEYTPSAPNLTEVDATNLPGVYKLSLTIAENNYDFNTIGGKSSTANISIIPTSWVNEQIDFNTTKKASINTEADTALSDINLDHLIKLAKDTSWAATVTKESIIDLLTSKNTSQTFDRATASLEANLDNVGAAGAGLTSLGDTRIANLDAAVSSRTKPADTQAAVTTVTSITNDVGITQVGADKVWLSISRTLTSFGTLVSDIWANATRTLSGFGTLVADIWANITRSLTDKANFTISGTKTTLDSLSGSDGDTIKSISDQIDNISTSDMTAIKNQTDKMNFAGTDIKATLDSETVMLTPAVQAGVTIPTATNVTNAVNVISNTDITKILADTNQLQLLISDSKLPVQVKGIDNDTITSNAISENAIDASALATDAVQEITSAIWAKIVDGTVTFEKAMKILLNITSTFNMTKSGNTYTYRDQAGIVILTITVAESSATSVISL